MFRALVAALALTVSSTSARAYGGFETGASLLAHCELPGLEICLGYVAGISDAMDSRRDAIGGWRACVPTGTQNSEIMDTAHAAAKLDCRFQWPLSDVADLATRRASMRRTSS